VSATERIADAVRGHHMRAFGSQADMRVR